VTPERWREIQRVFHEALERPTGERDAFVAAAAGGDDELGREVSSLLASAESGQAFLEAPAPGLEEPARTRVGPYEIVRELGHGGMGTVYLAQRADGPFRKVVALKVVRRGMDTEAVLRRFRQERQILAGLEHPHIARLLDGGNTEDGLPFLVMEYVEGEPLTAWCARRALGVADRLRLFRTVCAAVQFAHQNLVIHRDLKPGNILVTQDGVPKLLDFGVAKLLNAEVSGQTLDLTAVGGRACTPEYASPEQLRGERVTTTCDVYALGVLLYELLAGRRPYATGDHTAAEAAQAALETEPERPSAAAARAGQAAERRSRDLRGDLDTIVLTALRKDPSRRYASVEQLSEDVRRYLEGLPVKARKDTFSYRAGKFLRRHKAGAAAAALVLVSLVGGIGATARQARIARAERARADLRLADVRKLAGSFLFEFHDAIRDLPGSTPARDLIVRRALEYLGTLARESGSDPGLQRELAEAYEKLADVQGGAAAANLGDSVGALASYQAAISIRETLARAASAAPRDREDLAAGRTRLSKMYLKAWDVPRALAEGRSAVGALAELSRSDDSAPLLAHLASARHNLGLLLDLSGDREGALAELGRATGDFAKVLRQRPNEHEARHGLAMAWFEIASVRNHLGDFRAALETVEKALKEDEALVAADPTNVRYRMDLAFAAHDVGEYEVALGELPGALEAHRKALALVDDVLAADPRNAHAQVAAAYCANGLGAALARSGDRAGALRLFERAAGLSESVLAADPTNGYARRNLAWGCENAGDALTAASHGAFAPPASQRLARGWYARSLAAWTSLRGQGKLSGEDERRLVEIEAALAHCDAVLASNGSRNPKSRPSQ
jgi:eukaryotic-like serine/threonine-protein kinase